MAVDTLAKRASVLSYGTGPTLLIIPDATIGAGDRQTACHEYSGILANAPAAGGFFSRYYYDHRIGGAA